MYGDDEEVDVDARKCAWARLLAKVHKVDPMVCPKCGAQMKVVAVIEDPDEQGRILRQPGRMADPDAATRPAKIGRSPPGTCVRFQA